MRYKLRLNICNYPETEKYERTFDSIEEVDTFIGRLIDGEEAQDQDFEPYINEGIILGKVIKNGLPKCDSMEEYEEMIEYFNGLVEGYSKEKTIKFIKKYLSVIED